MPRIDTLHFGSLDYSEDALLEFPTGLPAFEDQTCFVLIERPDSSPLVFLQSLGRPELVFLALPALVIEPGYQLDVPHEERALLGLPADVPLIIGRDLLCLAILTVAGCGPATANLMAPVVVNLATRRGAQVIQTDSSYSYRHPLFQQPEEQPCS